MRSLNLPPTRENIAAAASGEWVALFDCLECANGVYVPGMHAPACTVCGAQASPGIASVMAELAEKPKAA